MSFKTEIPRLWVIAECYPKPWALQHCLFAHRQLVGLAQAGWQVKVLLPNGWHPPVAWRAAAAWRNARAAQIPANWNLDGIGVESLTFQNRVPSRLCRPTNEQGRITNALINYLARQELQPERDVLLAQFALPYGSVAQQAAQTLGLPYCVYLRGDDVWVDPHRDSGKRSANFVACVRSANLVLSVSHSLLNEAERLAETSLKAAAVVPNGIDLKLFRPPRDTDERQILRARLGLAEDELAVVCVGDAIARKGWRELIAALGHPSLSRHKIALLAAASARAAEIDLAKEIRLRAPHVRLLDQGNQSAAQLAEIYRAGDIFCLLSYWEGMANVMLEAMASGLPIVTTHVAGHPEAVTSGKEGFLVTPRAVEESAAALEKLLAASDLRQYCGRAARLRAERIGDARKAGQRLARLLNGVRFDAPDADLLNFDPYAASN